MNDGLTYSEAGFKHTKQAEGLRLTAYKESDNVWTVGYGHTGKDVTAKTVITEEQAHQFLAEDVESAARCVRRVVTVELTQGQFDALVDFTFNLGCGQFSSSTLLKKINTSDHEGAALEFPRWVHVSGKKLLGLVKRREANAAMYRG